MKTDLNGVFAAKNELVKNGRVVEASQKYFAQNAITVDFDGTVTNNKDQIVGKMQNFAGSIAKVNGITLHHAALNGNVSFAEFTFDFEMQDGSKVYWHEVIRTVWENEEIVHEQYFKG